MEGLPSYQQQIPVIKNPQEKDINKENDEY